MTTYSPAVTTTTAARPAAWIRALPFSGAFAGLAFAAAQGLLPEQAQPFEQPSDYLLELLFAVSLVVGAAATLALRHLGVVPRSSRFATVAVGTGAAGQALLAVAAGATFLAGQNTLGPLFLLGLLLHLVGGVLTAIAAVRARVLPRPLAVGLGAALPVSMVLGTWGPMVGVVLAFAVAETIRRRL
jgi:hypothetical protein